jgi:hypothetical protein
LLVSRNGVDPRGLQVKGIGQKKIPGSHTVECAKPFWRCSTLKVYQGSGALSQPPLTCPEPAPYRKGLLSRLSAGGPRGNPCGGGWSPNPLPRRLVHQGEQGPVFQACEASLFLDVSWARIIFLYPKTQKFCLELDLSQNVFQTGFKINKSGS